MSCHHHLSDSLCLNESSFFTGVQILLIVLISLEDSIGLPKPLKYFKKTFSQDTMLIYSCRVTISVKYY